MNKEKWIEEILQVTRQVKQAEVNPYLATRVAAALEKQPGTAVAGRLPMKWVYLSAAAMILLVALNVMAWSRPLPQKQSTGIQSVMQEYGWSNNSVYSANF
ncbi:MAG TPA: hypothetical protein VGM41_16180 [Chitinophagaceae bacterium]